MHVQGVVDIMKNLDFGDMIFTPPTGHDSSGARKNHTFTEYMTCDLDLLQYRPSR